MNLEDLNLEAPVQLVARNLWESFPGVIFTSGRRSLKDQARAMAENVALNRRWISQTYVLSIASGDCQKWIDENPEATTPGDIEAGLFSVLGVLSPDELKRLSKHLIGRAFDIQPMGYPTSLNVKAWLYARASTTGGKFLEREGGLPRWHFEL